MRKLTFTLAGVAFALAAMSVRRRPAPGAGRSQYPRAAAKRYSDHQEGGFQRLYRRARLRPAGPRLSALMALPLRPLQHAVHC